MDNSDIAVDIARDHLGPAPSSPPDLSRGDRGYAATAADAPGVSRTRAAAPAGGTLLGNPRRVRL